jgi:hypothetical protein
VIRQPVVDRTGNAVQPDRAVAVGERLFAERSNQDDVGVGVDERVLQGHERDCELGQLLHEPTAHGRIQAASQTFLSVPGKASLRRVAAAAPPS